MEGCCWWIIAGDSQQREIYAVYCQGIELLFFFIYICIYVSHILMLPGGSTGVHDKKEKQ